MNRAAGGRCNGMNAVTLPASSTANSSRAHAPETRRGSSSRKKTTRRKCPFSTAQLCARRTCRRPGFGKLCQLIYQQQGETVHPAASWNAIPDEEVRGAAASKMPAPPLSTIGVHQIPLRAPLLERPPHPQMFLAPDRPLFASRVSRFH